MKNISRRDFLKVAGAAVASVTIPFNLRPLDERIFYATRPNIIIILMDALSARNLSLYGYVRPTSPNIEDFASRSTVFHNHLSSGTFTTTGTASMLTGMIP